MHSLAGDTNRTHIFNPFHKFEEMEIQSRSLLTFVRDPIDHFLSAWKECGFRVTQNEAPCRANVNTVTRLPNLFDFIPYCNVENFALCKNSWKIK